MLVWYLPACASFQAIRPPPPSQEAIANTDRAIVTAREGDSTVTAYLSNPWLRNDSIGGVPCTKDWQCDWTAQWAASLAHVPVIMTRTNSNWVVPLVIVGVVVVGGVVFAAAMMENLPGQ